MTILIMVLLSCNKIELKKQEKMMSAAKASIKSEQLIKAAAEGNLAAIIKLIEAGQT